MSKSIEQEAKMEGESPQMEKAENKAGVDVSEEFQTKAHHLVHKASKHELHHLSRKIDDRHTELRKEEMKSEKSSKHPDNYSTEEAPGMDV